MRDGDEDFRANSCALSGAAIARAAPTTDRALQGTHMRRMSLAGLKLIHVAPKNL